MTLSYAQLILIAVLAAVGAIAWASPFITPYFTAALASLRQTTPAAPADVAEPKKNPADLLMDAARLYVQRGEHAKAVKVFAMAAEPEGGA